MLTFDLGNLRFNHRVAGVCVHEGHVLLTHAEGEDFWILPGGRVEIHEDTRTALQREMVEELGCEVEIGRLLWVVEDFFERPGRNYHEVAFIYKFVPSDESILERAWTRNITDGGVAIEFRWFPLGDLETVNLQPAFLKGTLSNIPTSVERLIVRE